MVPYRLLLVEAMLPHPLLAPRILAKTESKPRCTGCVPSKDALCALPAMLKATTSASRRQA